MRAWSGSKKCSGRSVHRELLEHPVVDQHRAEERRLGLEIGGQGLDRRSADDSNKASDMREALNPSAARHKPTTLCKWCG